MDNGGGRDAVDHPVGAANSAHPIFGNICLAALEDKCYSVCGCMQEHTLLPKEQVQRNLELSERKDIDHALNYLFKYDKLLVDYFSVFTKYFGRRKWPEYLRQSIESIADKRDTNYLKEILNGFLICGMQYHTAIDSLLNELPTTVDQAEHFHLLWKIMLDTRNKKVRDHLQLFEECILKENDGTASQFINELMRQLNLNEFTDLIMFCIKVLKNCAITTFHRLDNDPLKEFLSNLFVSSKTDAVAITRRVEQLGKQIEWFTQLLPFVFLPHIFFGFFLCSKFVVKQNQVHLWDEVHELS